MLNIIRQNMKLTKGKKPTGAFDNPSIDKNHCTISLTKIISHIHWLN